jgi:hypothetical protein
MKNYILNAAFFFGGFLIGLSIGLTLHGEKTEPTKYTNTLQQSTYTPTMQPLLWEKNAPHRKEWSKHLFREVEKNIDILDKASDMDYFCPSYSKLEKQQRINVWAQLFVAMSYYESAFKPTARYVEPTRDIDPVTGGPVISEGLLQLGYSDKLYHGCQFNWERDQKYSDEDPRKTILDPYTNLSCGVMIMTQQIQKYGSIAINNGAYWAVIKIGHRNQKTKEIKEIIINYDMCTQ